MWPGDNNRQHVFHSALALTVTMVPFFFVVVALRSVPAGRSPLRGQCQRSLCAASWYAEGPGEARLGDEGSHSYTDLRTNSHSRAPARQRCVLCPPHPSSSSSSSLQQCERVLLEITGTNFAPCRTACGPKKQNFAQEISVTARHAHPQFPGAKKNQMQQTTELTQADVTFSFMTASNSSTSSSSGASPRD